MAEGVFLPMFLVVSVLAVIGFLLRRGVDRVDASLHDFQRTLSGMRRDLGELNAQIAKVVTDRSHDAEIIRELKEHIKGMDARIRALEIN